MTTTANIEDRSLSRLVGSAPGNNCAVSPAIHSRGPHLRPESAQTAYAAQPTHQLRSFYAKQTQFAECSNQRNYCSNNGLSKYQTVQTPENQTQFQPHYPRTAQATINMQNKPNFAKPKMNITSYCNSTYESIRLREPRKNKPNFNFPIEDRSLSRLVGSAPGFSAQ